MPKSKIRPARTPKAEPPKVTIANLNLQIKLLTQRCVDLVASRDQETRHGIEYRRQRDEAEVAASYTKKQAIRLDDALKLTELELARLCGYQKRVREEDKHRYGDLPGAST